MLVMVMCMACGSDKPAPPDASSRLSQWSCREFVDCAGSAHVVTATVTAGTEGAAELQLVDACEQMPCSGALACHAICTPEP
jgi:hypothetical protein